MNEHAPLANRLRPQVLDEFVGQKHVIGTDKPLRKLLSTGQIASVIFWGPPGSGKTTLAHLIAKQLEADFVPFSAVTSGLPDLRKIIARATENSRIGRKTLLFIDEIHRWNKSQQDALLPHVETGTVALIGATTENPSFEVNNALLSRAQVYRLHELQPEDLATILDRALADKVEGLGSSKVKITKDAREFLLQSADGDARTLLNTLEVAAGTNPAKKTVTLELLQDVLTRKALLYDKKGEDHYNTISAFIKSMRGSDPDAAVYYLARMLEAGEDARFVARRMVVFASEDIGNADPHALMVAIAAFDAVSYIGMPEVRINLAQAATYLASAPKSNAAYKAIEDAWREVRQTGSLPVPLHLRNAPTQLMKDEGFSKGYQYAHKDADAVVTHHHLPDKIRDRIFYHPGERGHEAKIKQKLAELRDMRLKNDKKRAK